MQGFVNFGDADIPLSAHLIPPMCHGLIQIQFFLPTCLTTQRRARCFSPEERNNVFDKRGPFRFHIPEDRPTNRESFITPVSLSPTHFLHACRYWGESREWCIPCRAGRPWWHLHTYWLPVCLSRFGVRSHVRELLANVCAAMHMNSFSFKRRLFNFR